MRDRLCQNCVKTVSSLHLHKHSMHTWFYHRRKCVLHEIFVHKLTSKNSGSIDQDTSWNVSDSMLCHCQNEFLLI